MRETDQVGRRDQRRERYETSFGFCLLPGAAALPATARAVINASRGTATVTKRLLSGSSSSAAVIVIWTVVALIAYASDEGRLADDGRAVDLTGLRLA